MTRGHHRWIVNVGNTLTRAAHRRKTGEAVIDAMSGRRVTFGELNDRVNQLAHGIVELDLAPGDRVAILSTNTTEYFEVFYACAKTGLIAQPLNWRLAVPELRRILDEGEPRLVIYNSEFAAAAAELQSEIGSAAWIEMSPGNPSAYEDLMMGRPTTEPRRGADDDDPFFILYTGGTTGLPKGAVHTHRSTTMAMYNQTVGEGVAHEDVYMLTGQMFHIPVVLAMNYLAHARPVVLINFDPKLALEVIEREGVSAFLGITTMLNYMMAVPEFEDYDLSSLRQIQYGGGPMPVATVREALARFPCDLMQGYGQTEGCGMTFLPPWVHREAVAGINEHRLRSCGLEAHMSTLRVVSVGGIDVARDGKAVGEIIVESEANMVGYWNQPDVTAETIRDGWMWTGDLATWDDAGFIYIVDRKKDMIISGGENIYASQVERAVYQHPAVLEAAVIGIPDDVWGESVHAIVALKPGGTATDQEIVDAVATELASYMKPRSVEFVTELPKGPTGKILKHELRSPFWPDKDAAVPVDPIDEA